MGQGQPPKTDSRTPEIRNKRAGLEFEILETVEAGIALCGTEVKSLRAGQASLGEAYARIDDGQAWLINFQIEPYKEAGPRNHDPKRRKQLLLHRREIDRLEKETTVKGMTLVVTRIYWKNGRIKFEIGVARGKKLFDKRETLKSKTIERETRAQLKENSR